MDRNLALELVRVTEAAALASARFFGKGDSIAADRAAVEAMELAIRAVKITGHVVIGEDRITEQSRLCAGDVVGAGGESEFDLAIDPLDCIEALADGQNNSVSAIAMGARGAFKVPDVPYAHIMAVGAEASHKINLRGSVFENLVGIAEAKRVYVEDLTVSVLDREYHAVLISEVRRAGARIELLRDGDLSGVLSATLPGTGIDVFMGIGDSRKAIIAAAAAVCVGAGFQVQFLSNPEICVSASNTGFSKIYEARELVGDGDVMFAATGVSKSDFLGGVMFRPGGAVTHSIVCRRRSGTIRFLRTEHFFEKAPDYS